MARGQHGLIGVLKEISLESIKFEVKMTISALYTSILGIIFVFLSIRTLRLRRRLKIAIGDGGNEQMLRAMRVHSNFAEYVPIALIALLMVESSGAPKLLVHFLGGVLLMGRISHAYGVSNLRENFFYRVAGMSLTFISIVSSSIYIFYRSIFG
jgi:uncharacterized membrane protein YecN with MAPEG domain